MFFIFNCYTLSPAGASHILAYRYSATLARTYYKKLVATLLIIPITPITPITPIILITPITARVAHTPITARMAHTPKTNRQICQFEILLYFCRDSL